MGFFDVYALAPVRNIEAVESFLNHFVPNRKPSAEEYPVPQYSDAPNIVFQDSTDLIRYCVSHPNEKHTIYWRSLASGDPAHAMAFFTPDGGLILGLSVRSSPEQWLAELRVVGNETGLITFEQPPPATAAEFLSWIAELAGRAKA